MGKPSVLKIAWRAARRKLGRNLPWLGVGAVLKSAAMLLAVVAALPSQAEVAVDDLIKDLRYGTAEVREKAADSIRRGRHGKAEPALIEVLAVSQGALRLKVIRAIGEVGTVKSVQPLLGMLETPENDTRILAARSLGRIGHPAAEGPLLEMLKEGDFELRSEAAQALGSCGSKKAVKPLIKLLDDSNRVVRLAAVDSLGQLKDARALEPLVSMLDEKDLSTRRHVVKAVGALQGSSRISKLMGGWLGSKDVYLRGFAAEALRARPRDPSLSGKLVALLKDPELGVRVRAVETLGQWKENKAVASMKELLRGDSEILRYKAALALGQIGDVAAMDALKYSAENDPNLNVRKAAADALEAVRAKP